MRFSIVIVNTNEGPLLEPCLRDVIAAGGYQEIIVVDNASTDGSPEMVEREFPAVRLIRSPGNVGYSGANNLGVRASGGDACVLLNPDAYVTPGWLEGLAGAFADPQVAIASPKIYRGRPGTTRLFDSAGLDIEYPLGEGPARGYLALDAGQFDRPAEVAYASGAAFAVRRDVFLELEGLDEDFFCYCEESDLCWRARMRGYRCVYVPSGLVYHIGSATFGPKSPRKIYFQTRNRIMMCAQNLSARHLPAFFAAEIANGLMVLVAAPFFAKYRALGGAYLRAWIGAIRAAPLIARKHRLRQAQRTVSDDVVLRLHPRVSAGTMFARYFRMVRLRADSLYNPTAQLP